MSITYFEEVDINNLESYYSKEIEVDSKLIEIDLNLETKNLDPQYIENLNNSLKGISDLLATSWQWILNEYANGDEVNEYISFHLDDFFEDDPEEILAGTDPSLDNKDRFLKTLRVNRANASKLNYGKKL